jgi:putative membrane protein
MHWGGEFGMGFGFGGFFMILFWVLLILLIVYLVKILAGTPSSGKHEQVSFTGNREGSAEEVLKKRFARGEISKEEFEDAMQVLLKHRE